MSKKGLEINDNLVSSLMPGYVSGVTLPRHNFRDLTRALQANDRTISSYSLRPFPSTSFAIHFLFQSNAI
jgi:hypothetical protein